MHYNAIIRNFPESKYRDKALFAAGEYYYFIGGMRQAAEAFQTYVDENPEEQVRLYAYAYLLNIESDKTQEPDEVVIAELKKKIVDLQQVSLIFRDKKEITYTSPLNQRYKAVIRIDKIEFYVEGKLFAKVSY